MERTLDACFFSPSHSVQNDKRGISDVTSTGTMSFREVPQDRSVDSTLSISDRTDTVRRGPTHTHQWTRHLVPIRRLDTWREALAGDAQSA